MKKIMLISILIFSLFSSCKNKNYMNPEETKTEILNVVKSHNKAWAQLEDIHLQMKYVHPNILSISPPYTKVTQGIEEYKAGYLDWMKHAKVHYFKELDPVVTVLGDSKTAFVTFNIEMSFDFDSVLIENWKGIDFMTLVKENDQWKIISDMYAKKE